MTKKKESAPPKIISAISRSDGRAGFRVPKGTKEVFVNNQKIRVSKDGRVNIPKKIMEEYGTPAEFYDKNGNSKTRYVIGIQVGYGKDKKTGQNITGLKLIQPSEGQAYTVNKSGQIIDPYGDYGTDKWILDPSDEYDIYY